MNYRTTWIGLLLVIFGLVHTPALHAQTRYTWNGSDGSWDEPTNWSPNGIPAAADTAVVTAGFANLNTTLTVAGFEFTGGHVDGSGDLTITDAMTWSSGKWRGSVTARVAMGATLQITGTGVLYVDDDATFVHAGEGLWESPNKLSSNGAGDAQFVNEGTLELSFDATGDSHCIFVEFVNAPGGLIRRTGSGVANMSCPLTNEGTFRLEAGELGLNRARTDTGDWVIEAGATLRTINGTQTIAASGSLTGAGTLDLAGGRLDVDGEATIGTLRLKASNGLGGDGTVTVTEALDLQGGPMRDGGTTIVAPGATATLDGINLTLGDTRTLRIEGSFTWTGTSTIGSGTGETTIVNAGTMTSTGPGNRGFFGGTFRNEAPFVHDGDALKFSGAFLDNASTVRLDGGAMEINSHNSTFGGRYEIAPGATLRTINGAITFPESATITGTGTVDFSGGTVTNAAIWQPGLSSGVLSVDSNYDFDNSVLEAELGGLAPGTEHDVLAVTGTATLGGTLRIAIAEGYIPDPGDEFVVVTCAGGCSGEFGALEASDGFTFDVIYGASDVTVVATQAIPVELTRFEAAIDGETVVLVWETASETNNAGFEVQKREKGGVGAWKKTAFVEGGGTTAEPQSYRHRVIGLSGGAHLFRLKQIDFDGAFEYSPEVEITIGLLEPLRVGPIYPNPVQDVATLAVAVQRTQLVRAELFDVLGRRVAIVHDGILASHQTERLTIRLDSLPSGVYLLHVAGEQFAVTRRLILAR